MKEIIKPNWMMDKEGYSHFDMERLFILTKKETTKKFIYNIQRVIYELENISDSNCYAELCPECKLIIKDSIKRLNKLMWKSVNIKH